MSTFDKQKFGRRLKEMRIKAGYERQIDLAYKLGTVVQTISNYENGIRLPDAEMLYRIVDVLPCNADYLLGYEDKPTYTESYISEQTGLSSEAISSLIGLQVSLQEKYEEFRSGSLAIMNSAFDLISQFITSEQMPNILFLACTIVEILQEKEFDEQMKKSEPSGEFSYAIDRIGKIGAIFNEFMNQPVSPGMAFDLMKEAAIQQAKGQFGVFFDSFIFSLYSTCIAE